MRRLPLILILILFSVNIFAVNLKFWKKGKKAEPVEEVREIALKDCYYLLDGVCGGKIALITKQAECSGIRVGGIIKGLKITEFKEDMTFKNESNPSKDSFWDIVDLLWPGIQFVVSEIKEKE